MLDYPGVYIGKCLVNGKVYVGSSGHVLRRIREHKSALAKGKHRNCHLQAAYDKYGADNFKWYVISAEPENLFATEQVWIERKKASDPKYGFNRAYPVRANEPNPIASRKMKLYWEDPEYRELWLQCLLAGSRKVSELLDTDPEFAAMISQIRRGMWTPETKQKLSEQAAQRYKDNDYKQEHLTYLALGRRVLKEKRQDPEFVANQVKGMVANRRTPEARKKQAERMASLWDNPEFKAKQIAVARERIVAYNIKRARIRDSLNNSENEAVEVVDKEPLR